MPTVSWPRSTGAPIGCAVLVNEVDGDTELVAVCHDLSRRRCRYRVVSPSGSLRGRREQMEATLARHEQRQHRRNPHVPGGGLGLDPIPRDGRRVKRSNPRSRKRGTTASRSATRSISRRRCTCLSVGRAGVPTLRTWVCSWYCCSSACSPLRVTSVSNRPGKHGCAGSPRLPRASDSHSPPTTHSVSPRCRSRCSGSVTVTVRTQSCPAHTRTCRCGSSTISTSRAKGSRARCTVAPVDPDHPRRVPTATNRTRERDDATRGSSRSSRRETRIRRFQPSISRQLRATEVRVPACSTRKHDGVAAHERQLRSRRDRRTVDTDRAAAARHATLARVSETGSTRSIVTSRPSCTPPFRRSRSLRLVTHGRRARRRRGDRLLRHPLRDTTTVSCGYGTWSANRGATSTPSSNAATT